MRVNVGQGLAVCTVWARREVLEDSPERVSGANLVIAVLVGQK